MLESYSLVTQFASSEKCDGFILEWNSWLGQMEIHGLSCLWTILLNDTGVKSVITSLPICRIK